MGAFSVLLMIAVAGVTYGWRPDDRGGVEYIIQIPPDQIQELERLGELSSLIDPAVQGHVSRIVIKVGDGAPPRVTPPDLGRRANVATSRVEANDLSPVPIPEMSNANRDIALAGQRTSPPETAPSAASALPVRSDIAVNNSGPTASLKPQTQTSDPVGSGFSLPQLPSSLRDTAAAQGLRRDVDRAGRDITTRATNEITRATNGLLGPPTAAPGAAAPATTAAAQPSTTGLVQPPSTRTPNTVRAQPPAFTTGNNTTGGFAGTRPGGPTTAPTNSNASSWRDFAAQPPTAGPSTEPVGPSGFSFNNRPDASAGAPRTAAPTTAAPTTAAPTAAANTTATRGSTGLTARDTFGRPPGTTGTTTFGTTPAAENPFAAANRNTTPSPSTNTFPQTQFNAPSNRTAQPPATDPLANRATRSSAPPSFATSAGQAGSAQSSPDARLSAAQIAAGAWSVDIYGNPVDRQGRVVESLRNPTPSNYAAPTALGADAYGGNRAAGTPGTFAGGDTLNRMTRPGVAQPAGQSDYRGSVYADQAASLGQPRPSTSALAATNPQTATPFQSQLREPPTFDSRTQPITRQGASLIGDSGGSSRPPVGARDISTRTSGENQIDSPSRTQRTKPVAAQPFFNGLLLISFVANLYLVFWLRNLHSKYREMVAAKRLASANTAA